ncbi:hypothetical protein [Phenylobacterium soli]|uniref:Uncharacterized protein n=1 Tax=Phenylobacterium soli TaxID=2170551 RepID=A0A328ABG7_9CAUL|nr:hypothetical protein [Phenylobacterium soli]RAK51935.1 hypothetical protein DJ017_19185 [Phenylobacterium soli]
MASSFSSGASSSPAKAAAARLIGKVGEFADHLRSTQAVAQDAQIREAVTRTELTGALEAALAARDEARAGLRSDALRRYVAEAEIRRLRRRNRPARFAEQALARLGPPGQALVIAAAGVWRGGSLGAIAAYARRGPEPAAQPATLFDQAWYLAANPDVAAARVAPLAHYLLSGAREDRSPHPLIEGPWYRRQNAQALAATGLSALEHYVKEGAARGREPHPVFDSAHYLAGAGDIAAGETPLEHYLRVGASRGLSPHPLFDPVWYGKQARRSAKDAPALVHYLTVGWRKGFSPHPLFDPAWYLLQNGDVAQAGTEPLTHFLATGAREGRSPGPWFDLPHYVEARGAALPTRVNPLVDYLQGGAWTVTEARPGLPTAAYLAANPEIVEQGLTPLEHWARRQPR